jgi:hypothetical protein
MTVRTCPFCRSLNHTKLGQCPNIDPEQLAHAIARKFVALLRVELTPEQFRETKRRNRDRADKRSCASHDFCDANMVMADAFRQTGLEPDVDDGEQCALWGTAWDAAMPQLTKKGRR